MLSLLLCACGGTEAAESSAGSVSTYSTARGSAMLKASDSYGNIYPYAGGAVYSGVYGSDSAYITGYYYGMFDYRGNAVCDAVYTAVHRLTRYEPGDYLEIPLELWCLEYTGDDGSIKYGLASADGSFVTDCIYDNVYGIFCGAVAASDDGSFTVFAEDGTALYSDDSDGLCGRTTAATAGCISGGDGVIVFELDDGYYMFDLSGSMIAGPFYYIGDFSGGYASAAVGPGQYGIIDTKGGTVVSMSYDYTTFFKNGVALLETDGYYRVIDTDMNILIGMMADYASADTYGISCSIDGDWFFYSFDGDILLNDREYSWTGIYGTEFFYRSFSDGVSIYDVSSGKEMLLHGTSSVSPFYTMLGTAPIPYIQAYRTDSRGVVLSSYLMDYSLDTVYSCEGDCYWDAVQDMADGSWYMVRYENGDGQLFGLQLEELGSFSYSSSIYDGMVFTCTEDGFTAADFYGSTIFSCSFEG